MVNLFAFNQHWFRRHFVVALWYIGFTICTNIICSSFAQENEKNKQKRFSITHFKSEPCMRNAALHAHLQFIFKYVCMYRKCVFTNLIKIDTRCHVIRTANSKQHSTVLCVAVLHAQIYCFSVKHWLLNAQHGMYKTSSALLHFKTLSTCTRLLTSIIL